MRVIEKIAGGKATAAGAILGAVGGAGLGYLGGRKLKQTAEGQRRMGMYHLGYEVRPTKKQIAEYKKEISEREKISMKMAAYTLAVDRVVQATKDRGIYP